jgi:hypothetical protein
MAYCGLDVVVNDRDRGLRASAAPAGTIIEEYLPEYRELAL